jgi:hypothetical protein
VLRSSCCDESECDRETPEWDEMRASALSIGALLLPREDVAQSQPERAAGEEIGAI